MQAIAGAGYAAEHRRAAAGACDTKGVRRVVPARPELDLVGEGLRARPMASYSLSEFYAYAFRPWLRLPPVILEQRPELPA